MDIQTHSSERAGGDIANDETTFDQKIVEI